MSTFTIMYDTGCDMPQDYVEKHDLKIIPLPFHLNDEQYPEGGWQKITGEEFYAALRNGGVAGTALVNPDQWAKVFTEYAERGESLVVIPLSSGLSGTAQNSVIALNEVKETYPDCDIHTVDSINATSGIGVLIVKAVKMRAEGKSAAETAAVLSELRHSCFALFTVDDLMFLHRGGRVSKLQAIAGSIIGIKPLLNVSPEGTLKLKDKALGRKASLEALFNQMKRSLAPDTKKFDTVLIGHGDCIADANLLADLIKAEFEVGEFHIVMIGPIVGAHSGPGTIALFFEADMTRDEYEAKFYAGK